MSEWKMTITRTENGYLIETPDEYEDGNLFVRRSVVEEKMDISEAWDEAHRNLLHEVMEHFNFQGSKHDAKRLRIELEDQEQ